MKKLLLLIMLTLTLTACGGSDTPATEAQTEAVEVTETKTEAETEVETEAMTEAQKETYGLNETWTVDGQWELTVTNVEKTDYRNEFNESDPAMVTYIYYTYTNLGYENEYGDLFLMIDKAMDGQGKMGQSYPGDITLYNQETPVGGTIDVQDCFGFDNDTDTITIFFNFYDGNGQNQKATFEIPVN